MLPKDKRQKGYKIHRAVFWLVVSLYVIFLAVNRNGNSWLEYFVLIYFIGVVQWSRKINVTLHAVIASVGMVLLASILAFSLF